MTRQNGLRKLVINKGEKKVTMSQSLSGTSAPAKNSVRGVMPNNICVLNALLRARRATFARNGVISKGHAA